VVVVVTRDTGGIAAAYRSYRPVLARLGRPIEYIYVVHGQMPQALHAVRELKPAGEPVEILSFATPFGESAALTVGFRHAAGDVVFTLTPEVQIAPDLLGSLLVALDGSDLVVARRKFEEPRGGESSIRRSTRC